MPESASSLSVRVENGELRADTPFRSWAIRGWPKLTARERISHGTDGWRPWWRLASPEIDLLRAIILPLHTSGHEERRRWCRLASSPEPFRGTAADGSEPAWWLRRQAERRIIADYFADIPEAVRASVQMFRFRQWHLLVLVQQYPAALDLVQRNPALGFCLATYPDFVRQPAAIPTHLLRRLAEAGDEEICTALGFPQPGLAALLLSRIPPEACFMSGLAGLRWSMWWDNSLRADLADLPSLNEDLLGIITHPAMLKACSFALLQELAARPPDSGPSGSGLMWSIRVRVYRQFGEKAADSLHFRSMKHVTRLHAWLVRRERLARS